MLYCDLDGTVLLAVCPPGGLPPEGTLPLEHAADVLQGLKLREGWEIIYWTGRYGQWHDQTLDWLMQNGFPEGEIRMVDSKVKHLSIPDMAKGKQVLVTHSPSEAVILDDMEYYLAPLRQEGYVCLNPNDFKHDWFWLGAAIRESILGK